MFVRQQVCLYCYEGVRDNSEHIIIVNLFMSLNCIICKEAGILKCMEGYGNDFDDAFDVNLCKPYHLTHCYFCSYPGS